MSSEQLYCAVWTLNENKLLVLTHWQPVKPGSTEFDDSLRLFCLMILHWWYDNDDITLWYYTDGITLMILHCDITLWYYTDDITLWYYTDDIALWYYIVILHWWYYTVILHCDITLMIWHWWYDTDDITMTNVAFHFRSLYTTFKGYDIVNKVVFVLS